MEYVDQAVDVRSGEELNTATVETFLRDTIPHLDGQMTVRQFPGGHSNLTYLISFKNKEMVLRRPPFGAKARSAHDMSREYRILKALKPVFPYCPEPLAYSEDPVIMGCPFYVMERIQGIILRKRLPKGMSLTPTQVERLFETAVETHHALHSLDYHQIGLENFGKPEGYVRRQIEGWSDRYRLARTPDAPDFESVMTWLSDHQPGDSPLPCVIHNDFKFDNIVLDSRNPLALIGVLDWEMATIGDPLMDLGSSLGYWVEKNDPQEMQAMRTLPTHLEGALTRKQVAALYSRLSGRPIDNFEFYYGFGLFRLAVIAQQIYYRFYHGQTKDPRFESLIVVVGILEKTARQVMNI
ncbi:MAG TPA: phosphotransferase family protein [Desulfatirhabdiaceae bacterium]|nr:phosphotransferase family protein [Desulfatirhabdiaceae bacterium]